MLNCNEIRATVGKDKILNLGQFLHWQSAAPNGHSYKYTDRKVWYGLPHGCVHSIGEVLRHLGVCAYRRANIRYMDY